MQNQTARTDRLFTLWCLLGLTGFFALLEISFFIQCNKAYVADLSSVAATVDIPFAILPSILGFVLTHILIHISYCLFVFLIAYGLTTLFKISSHHQFFLNIILWALGIFSAIVANQVLYPQSKFTEVSSIFLSNSFIAKSLFWVLVGLCSFILIIAISGLIYSFRKVLLRNIGTLAILVLATLGYGLGFDRNSFTIHDRYSAQKPHVILIGVDSLRPDFLSHFNSERSTPFLDTWLQQATVFSEAITPLARTFPSWISILTGKYPKEIGIRFNLADTDGKKLNTLSTFLQQHGYETIFATDESRFSNIDESYGFDQVIAPPMGLKDFLLGTFNDFPLSNLLVNTAVGQWLFPYSYGNRAVYFTYEPNSFLKQIRSVIRARSAKPLFLAVHFCLPHYPYLWAGTELSIKDPLTRYAASIQRVDQQVGDLFAALNKEGLLRQAIVVVMSDHGEALELPGDRITDKDLFAGSQNPIPRFYPPSLDNEAIDQSAGHGTDVLGLTQYHSLLAFRLYGLGTQQAGEYPGVVSLLDIKPTILELLQFPITTESGKTLAPLLNNLKADSRAPRHFFLESDYSPEAIRSVYPQINKILIEGAQLFRIDPQSMRLTVKPSMAHMIIRSKQYADIYDDWMLALYPQPGNVSIPVLINLNTGKWTLCLRSMYAKNSPASEMLTALKAFYAEEITEITAQFC